MRLDSVGLLAADTARARAYVDVLASRNLRFAEAFLLPSAPGAAAPTRHSSGRFDNETPIAMALQRLEVPIRALPSADLNDPGNCAQIARSPVAFLVLAAPAGAIVRAPLFDTGKKIIHVHPGQLPEYRGSTTIYYSLLAERVIDATAIFLDEGIDTGAVIGRARFPAPPDRRQVDIEYDPWLRASLLADVLATLRETAGLAARPQDRAAGATFFIIHPVLKHLAILAKGGQDAS